MSSFLKNITKLVFLWPNMNQNSFKVLIIYLYNTYDILTKNLDLPLLTKKLAIYCAALIALEEWGIELCLLSLAHSYGFFSGCHCVPYTGLVLCSTVDMYSKSLKSKEVVSREYDSFNPRLVEKFCRKQNKYKIKV